MARPGAHRAAGTPFKLGKKKEQDGSEEWQREGDSKTVGGQQNAELSPLQAQQKKIKNQIYCIKKDPLASPSTGTEEFNTWNAAKG